MTGFSGISFLSMGVPYLLPAIAAVLVGGSLATGGRGHYLGILGGAVLLTAVGTLVSGAQLPIAVRDIVYGVVVLGAVLTWANGPSKIRRYPPIPTSILQGGRSADLTYRAFNVAAS